MNNVAVNFGVQIAESLLLVLLCSEVKLLTMAILCLIFDELPCGVIHLLRGIDGKRAMKGWTSKLASQGERISGDFIFRPCAFL